MVLSVSLPEFLKSANARAVIQSECMTVRSTASVVAALLSMGVMAITDNARLVIFLTSFLPILVLIASTGSYEEKIPSTSHLRYNCCDNMIKEYQASEITNIDSNNNNLPSYDESFASGDLSEEFLQGNADINSDNSPSRAAERNYTSLILGAIWLRTKLILRALVVLIRPVLFVFVVNTMPKYSTPWYSYLYSLDFPGWILSSFMFISLLGALVGSFLYLKIFSRISLEKVFFVSNVLDVIATIPMVIAASGLHEKWGISNSVFFVSVQFIDAIFGRIALMPSIVLAAESCPPQLGLESTMFSLFSSVTYASSFSSYAIQVLLTRYFSLDGKSYDKLPEFMMVCLACQLIPLLFIQILPKNDHADAITEQVNALENGEALKAKPHSVRSDESIAVCTSRKTGAVMLPN